MKKLYPYAARRHTIILSVLVSPCIYRSAEDGQHRWWHAPGRRADGCHSCQVLLTGADRHAAEVFPVLRSGHEGIQVAEGLNEAARSVDAQPPASSRSAFSGHAAACMPSGCAGRTT